MDKNSVLCFLKALSATQVMVGAQWITASCPLAPWQHQSGKDAHPSFAIKVDPDRESIYNCFSCGGGDLVSLVYKLNSYGATLPKYNLKRAMELAAEDGDRPVRFRVKDWGEAVASSPYVTFPEPWLATFHPALETPRARRYLRQKRRVSDSVITALDIRYDTERDTVCFPIRDFDGVLCGLRGRYIEPQDDRRYHMYGNYAGERNTVVWYGESWLDFDRPIAMCESVFDLAALYPLYTNVCAPLSVGFGEEKARRLRQAVEVVTLFDADKGGDKARERVNKYFRLARITHLYLPEGTDPGDLSPTELRELIGNKLKLKKE